jgi:type II secretory pathway component PulM
MTPAARFSKLKQRLGAWGEALEKLPPRQRLLALGGAGLLLVVVAYALVISPLLDLKDNWDRTLNRKTMVLQKYRALARNKQAVDHSYQERQKSLIQAEGQLLTGSNPAVASADLQEVLRNLTRTQGIQVTSTKVLPPQESGEYLEVPLEVQMTCTIDQLVTMLYRLEHHEKLMVITDLDVNAQRRRRRVVQDDSTLRANMVVAGLMKKSAGN